MSIRVYNRYLDLLFEIDRYQSLQFKRNFHGIANFELHVNRYINGADTLGKGHLIALNKHNNKVGIIQSKEIALDESGKETENFKLTGYTLDGLMQRRITVPPSHTSHDRISGSAESVMKHYVYNNFINTTRERQMPFLEIADNQSRGEHIKYESRYKTVSDELENISISTGLGWGIFANFSTKKLIFDVIERRDLTQGNRQGNNPVFFSPEFETIKSQEFIDSDNDLRNVGFVGGQGEGVDRKIVKIGDVSGWDRIETFVDARDISDEDEETEEELTDEEVEELLIDRGKKKMADMETIFTLEAEILTPTKESVYEYEKDFDLGDRVDVVNKSWNLKMTAPITEITEIYESDGFKLDAVFGRNRPTLISKLNDKFNELEGIEKQEAPERVSVTNLKEAKKYAREQDEYVREDAQDFADEAEEKSKKHTNATDKQNREYTDALMKDAHRQIDDTKARIDQAEKDLGEADKKVDNAVKDVERLEKELDDLDLDFEIGGVNLILDSNRFDNWAINTGVTATFETVEVEEWGAKDATRIQTSGGDQVRKLHRSITGAKGMKGVYSIWIKNIGENAMRLRHNGFSPTGGSNYITIEPGESRRVVIVGRVRDSHDWFQPMFYTMSGRVDDDLDFIVWRDQFEEGTKATSYQRSPEDIQAEIDKANERINTANKDIKGAQDLIDSVTEDKNGQTVLKGTLITNELIAEDATLTGSFKGSNATIEELTTNNMTAINAIVQDAVIKGTLNATQAIFKEGTFDKATIQDAIIKGELGANDATMLGLTTEEMTAINAIIQDATITGRLNASDAIFQKGRFNEATIVDAIIENVKGLTGTFKDVKVTDGDFNLEDENSGVEYSATPRRNLIKDHSFELIREDRDSIDDDSLKHNWLDILPDDVMQFDSPWRTVREPKVVRQYSPDSKDALAIYGDKAIVVRNAHYVRQYIWDSIGAGSQYTVSAFFKRQWKVTGGGKPVIQIWHVNAFDERLEKLVSATFSAVKDDYTVERHAATFTVPSNFQNEESLEVIVSGGNDNWVQCDGVQMVEGDRPAVYQPEDSIWDITKGNYRPIMRTRNVLYSGAVYPSGSQTVKPDKTLPECIAGWVLQFQRYVKGEGTSEGSYNYYYVPKTHGLYNSGKGIRLVLARGRETLVTKYLYIYNDRIEGHDTNGTGNRHELALTGVYEY